MLCGQIKMLPVYFIITRHLHSFFLRKIQQNILITKYTRAI